MAKQPELATEQEVADHLGITREALEQRRRRGTAPKHRKISRSVVYLWADVTEWEDTRLEPQPA